MLRNLINRHDAVRLYRKLRKRQVIRPSRLSMQLMRQCLAAEDQALSRLGHDFTYSVCSARVEPGLGLQAGHVTAARARAPARPGYDAA